MGLKDIQQKARGEMRELIHKTEFMEGRLLKGALRTVKEGGGYSGEGVVLDYVHERPERMM